MNAFLITKGDYDDFRVVASFSTKDKAQETLDLLNNGIFANYDMEEVPMDTVPGAKAGFKAEFNFVENPDEVTMDNIVFTEALIIYPDEVLMGSHSVQTNAETKEECFNLILNEMTKPQPAKREENMGALVWELHNA